MFNICPRCGKYAVEKQIDPSGPFALCPFCDHPYRFRQLPLFIITGASGTGKSTVCLSLAASLPACVCLESDILWREEFATPADDFRAYRDLWLRVAKNINQSGRPVALFGSAVPNQFESCPERRYFSDLHYLAFVCDDALLAARLRERPSWRQSGRSGEIERMIGFNRWIEEHAAETEPPMSLLDTSDLTLEESTDCTSRWISERLPSP